MIDYLFKALWSKKKIKDHCNFIILTVVNNFNKSVRKKVAKFSQLQGFGYIGLCRHPDSVTTYCFSDNAAAISGLKIAKDLALCLEQVSILKLITVLSLE